MAQRLHQPGKPTWECSTVPRHVHTAFVAASLVLPFVANQAHASLVTESFTGTIAGTFTTDTHGWFGTFGVGSDLSGATVTGSYSYDPGLMDFPINNSGVDTYVAEGTNADAITVTISINGHTYTVNSETFGQVETSSNDGTIPDTYELFVHGANSDNDAWYTLFGAGEWVAGASPALIDSPIDFADVEQQLTIGNGSDYFLETLSFNLASIGNGPATSTPEPASTGLLLAGVLGLSVAKLRRR
jgi:hypothetical protein